MLCHGRDSTLRTLALVALLVLGLGLPRLFVICIHADGVGRVELMHAAGACCAEEPQHAVSGCCADHAGDKVAPPSRGCEHVHFAVELAPPPSGQDHHDEPPPVFGWTEECATTRSWGTPVPHPPATGPPRTDQRTLLRATTLLLL